MNVLILTSNFPRREGDYAGVFLVRLLAGLAEFQINPIVLAPHAPGAAEDEKIGGVRVIRFRYDSDASETVAYSGAMQQQLLSPLGWLRLRRMLGAWSDTAERLVRSEQIDLIAAHWLIPTGLVLSRLAKRTGLPMVLSSHGTDVRLAGKFPVAISFLLRDLWPRLAAWSVVSTYLAGLAKKINPEMASRLQVLPLPMNEELFRQGAADARDPHLIVCVTKYTRQKRVNQFVRAVHLAREHYPALRAEIYAAGPDQDHVARLIAELGETNAIRMCAPVSQAELAKTYQRAGMVVLNSVEEGFGAVLVEAMHCGAPVIGSDSGGIRDIIEHEKSGLLVSPDDIPALSTAIIRLVSDPALTSRLGTGGQQRAETVFSSANLIRRYADIIRAAASGR